MFQFLIGSLKTQVDAMSQALMRLKFQFLIGSLKTRKERKNGNIDYLL